MRLRSFACIILVVVLLSLTFVGCQEQNTDNTTTSGQVVSTDTTTNSGVTGNDTNSNSTTSGGSEQNSTNTNQTTVQGGTGTTTEDEEVIIVGTTLPSGETSTTAPSVITTPTTAGESDGLFMKEVSVYGLPAIVGDSRNRLRVSAAGVLNGNAANPMYILVTNIGEDAIYSATLTATAGGKEICFNISYLPRGASVWAESVDRYVYNANDKFSVKTDAVIVTSTSASVPVDTDYGSLLRIYTGIRNGGRGLFVENISGKKITKVVVKYRPVASGGGLYSAPSELVIKNFEKGSIAFKANSYLYDAEIVDVQITY